MRTLEELERLAYISGDIKTAALLAESVDQSEQIEALLLEVEDLEDQIRNMDPS